MCSLKFYFKDNFIWLNALIVHDKIKPSKSMILGTQTWNVQKTKFFATSKNFDSVWCNKNRRFLLACKKSLKNSKNFWSANRRFASFNFLRLRNCVSQISQSKIVKALQKSLIFYGCKTFGFCGWGTTFLKHRKLKLSKIFDFRVKRFIGF